MKKGARKFDKLKNVLLFGQENIDLLGNSFENQKGYRNGSRKQIMYIYIIEILFYYLKSLFDIFFFNCNLLSS